MKAWTMEEVQNRIMRRQNESTGKIEYSVIMLTEEDIAQRISGKVTEEEHRAGMDELERLAGIIIDAERNAQRVH